MKIRKQCQCKISAFASILQKISAVYVAHLSDNAVLVLVECFHEEVRGSEQSDKVMLAQGAAAAGQLLHPTVYTVKIYILSVTRLVVLDYESMPFQIESDPIFQFAGSIYLKKPNRKNHYFGQIKLKLLFYFILVESGKIIWIRTDTDPHTGLV